MVTIDDYRDRYENIAISREDGVLQVRLHTAGGPLVWSAAAHRDLGPAFAQIGMDTGNRVVMLSGTGDAFCVSIDHQSFRGFRAVDGWSEGKRLLQALVDIDVPVVAVVNGPATIHAELLVLADIVVAAHTATFADHAHFVNGAVPGDGVHLIWPHLLGPNRARHFLLTGRELSAAEALDLGVVAEVVPSGVAHERGLEIARELASHDHITLRCTREVLVAPFRQLLHGTGLSNGIGMESMAIIAASRARRQAD
jgi:enoyl-CoA hydratase/carnithine racemase